MRGNEKIKMEDESQIKFGKTLNEVEVESLPKMSDEEMNLEVECPFCGEDPCVCEDDMSGATPGER